MGCCAGKGGRRGNRRTRNVVVSGSCRTTISKMPRAGKRKDRKAQGHAR